MKLQNIIKDGFEKVNEHLRAVSKAQRDMGKSLDKVLCFRPNRTTVPCSLLTIGRSPFQ